MQEIMHSIRYKIVLLTVAAIVVSIFSIGLISIYTIRAAQNQNSRDRMFLTAQNVSMSLDSYLNSVEQSVETVYNYASEDLSNPDHDMESHLAKVNDIFNNIASHTNGLLTYYYRIDPKYDSDNQGFWYYYKDGHMIKNVLTEVDKFDEDDMEHVGWFYTPKKMHKSIWLDPYYNDNIGIEMISYVAPVFTADDTFVGVIGVDISYEMIVNNLKNISIYNTGYVFLTDSNGRIVYHPELEKGADITNISPELHPDNLSQDQSYASYTYEGSNKRASYAKLTNGMYLYAVADDIEINSDWLRLTFILIMASLFILVAFLIIGIFLSGHITKPLSRLTEAAQKISDGNYDLKLSYDEEDEVGILTKTFNQLTEHLKAYINDLNSKAYTDGMTSLRNSAAFNAYKLQIEDLIANEGKEKLEFALAMFDCNNLKEINDQYGHDKGDIYLRKACKLICDVFEHSPVFRIGGDEFVVGLTNQDFYDREMLIDTFVEKANEINASDPEPWERISVAKGLATFDPQTDSCVDDVLRKADESMYEDKWFMKENGI